MSQINPIYILLDAVVLALVVTLITAPPVIRYLRDKKLGQQIRDDGPQRHLTKAGTPTMGGVIILVGLIIGVLFSWSFLRPIAWRISALLLVLGVAFAEIGSIDDWGKIKHGRSLGLRAREKLILQFVCATLFTVGLVMGLHRGTTIGIPGIGLVDLGWWYWLFAVLFIAGMSNAVNLTDGLDGLAAGTTVPVAVALGAMAWLMHSQDKYPQAIAIVAGCLGAACLAFLWFNRHPAQVFMGDTGSLAIGAILAGIALALKQEILLLVIGLIFLIEMGSVIIQVIAFKTTGKRVFRMSPFHHHLELGGWSEPQIVTRAWALAVVLAGAGVALALLKK